MENCNECPCSCKPISDKCIQANSSIADVSVLGTDDFTKATDDIDDLIGADCAEMLCEALSKAAEDAEANDNSISDNLAQIWLDIINNRHFQSWYANRLLFHWVYGASISQIAQAGLVTARSDDDNFNNAFEHASEKERKRIQDSAQTYSDKARTKFLKTYWLKPENLSRYPCYELECGCTKKYKCKIHCPPPPRVQMTIV